MKDIVFKGMKGKKKEISNQINILFLVYICGSFFLIFENSFIKSREKVEGYYDNIPFIDVMFQDGKIMILLLSMAVIIIGVVIINLSQRRKYTLNVLRGLGSSILTIIMFILWENLYIWGIGTVLGIAIGGISAVLIDFIVISIMDLPLIISFPWMYICEYLIFTGIVFFTGTLVVVLQVVNLDLGTSFKREYSLLELVKVPVLKKAEKITFFRSYKRNRIFHWGSTCMRMGISIVIIIISSVSIHLFCDAQEQYNFMKSLSSSSYVFSTPKLMEGLTIDQINEVKDIQGVESVEIEKYINTGTLDVEGSITVSFPGWKDDEYVKTHRKYTQTASGMENYDKDGDYFVLNEIRGIPEDDEERFQYYEKSLDEGEFNKKKFNQGKECILFLSPYQVRDKGFDVIDKEAVYVTDESIDTQKIFYYEKDKESVKPGDYIMVSTPWGSCDIQVAGIVRSQYSTEMGSNIIAVGEQFLDMVTNASESRYNAIRITADEEVDSLILYDEISEFFSDLNPENYVSNEGEVLNGITENYKQEMIQYLVIICVVWTLYLLIMFQANSIQMENDRRGIGILGSLGMSRSKLKEKYIGENIIEMTSVIGSSLVVLFVWFLWKVRVDTSFDSVESLISELSRDTERVRMFIISLIVSIIIVMGISIVTLFIPLVKTVNKSIMENLRNE